MNLARKEENEYSVFYKGYISYYRITANPRAVLPPIFFVSGAFQNMDSWSRFERYFSEYSQVVVADLPGVGKAGLLPEEYGLDFYAATVKNILDHAGIDRTYMISTSYGSPIAYTVAQHYPERIERLVLSGIMREIPCNIRPTIELSLKQIENNELDAFIDAAVETLCSTKLRNRSSRHKLSERMLRRQLRQMSGDDFEKYVTNTRRLLMHKPLDLNKYPDVPTLVLTGENDHFTLPAYCMEIARAIPGAEFLTIDDGDHLFHIQAFDTTIKILENFGYHLPLDKIPGTRYYPVQETKHDRNDFKYETNSGLF